MPTTLVLPPRQSELLQIIARSIREGHTPLCHELIEAMGLARESSLMSLLQPLERKGLVAVLRNGRGVQRAIDLTLAGRLEARMGIPVLGRIAAGPMMLAQSEVLDWLDPGTLLKTQPGDFLLQAAGDSMIGDGILAGDRVLVRPNVVIGNGEIAAVVDTQDDISGEHYATLKHVYHTAGQKKVRLRASNPKYEDMILPAERVRIVGAYRGLYRPFD